jgi:glucan 1,3-beta-glucosidase
MQPLAPSVGAGAGASIPMSESRMSMASRSNRDSMAYQNIPSEQYWNEPSRHSTGPLAPQEYEEGPVPGKSNKKKWITGGVILGILAVIGIVVGVVVSQTRGGSNNGNGGSGSGSSSSGNNTTDLSNPSEFEKDSRLHQSFWAMAYTPEVSI